MSFVGAKAKNVSEEKKAEGWGDCWTWTALDADTKLMISFRLSDRTLATAYDFMHDLADRIANRIQGAVVLVAGLAAPLFGVERTRAILDWESTQGTALIRVVAGLALAIGGFVAFAVATGRRPKS